MAIHIFESEYFLNFIGIFISNVQGVCLLLEGFHENC